LRHSVKLCGSPFNLLPGVSFPPLEERKGQETTNAGDVGRMQASPGVTRNNLHIPWLSDFKLGPRVKALLVAFVIIAFTIQALRVLLSAYPVMSKGVWDGSTSSLDFGAYYMSAWRLIHNPSQLYAHGTLAGDYALPLGTFQPGFKYLPFFSFFMLPLLALRYIPALVVWDVFQFILMPVMGLLIYKALKSVNAIVILVVIWIILLQPIPFPPHYTISFYDLYTSQSYYWQWAEGQAKVFASFFIVATYYFSKSRRPILAGIACGLAFFDPRFPVFALPLFLIVNRGQYRRFSAATVVTLAVGDAILLYDGLAASFYTNVLIGSLGNAWFQYTWIPFYTIVALTAVEGIGLIYGFWRRAMAPLPNRVSDDARSLR